MLDTTTQLYIAGSQASADETPLTFITGLKYNTNIIKAYNNLTFLYDPNWEYESENPTYPIAFFHVRKMTEDMASEVSQRPMLFYNSESDTSNSVKAGLMNVVADNVIIKPKVYKLDILVPMSMEYFFSGSYFNIDNQLDVRNFLRTKTTSKEKSSTEYQSELLANRQSALVNGAIKTFLHALYGSSISVSSLLTMMTNQQDYNKNSIEYMWRNRRVLKLKVWTGWQFKYLVIQNFEISKEGTNGDFFEGTLTCQEMPIITTKSKSQNSRAVLSKVSSLLGKGIKTATKVFVATGEATWRVKE